MDLGGADIEEEFFVPLQAVLQQTRSAKGLTRWAFSHVFHQINAG